MARATSWTFDFKPIRTDARQFVLEYRVSIIYLLIIQSTVTGLMKHQGVCSCDYKSITIYFLFLTRSIR